jgi:transcriptional regulator with XRE-family HTH domain
MNNPEVKFPNRLRRKVYETGEAMRRVGMSVGIEPQVLSRYSKGYNLPTIYNAHRIAKYLGCTIEDIWIIEDAEERAVLLAECAQNADPNARHSPTPEAAA